MTDTPVSPLRRRMIEDMTIRKLAPKTQASYIRAVGEPDPARLPWPFSGPGERGGLAALSTASGLQRRGGSQPERRRDGATVLLHRDACARRGYGSHAVRARDRRKLPVVLSPEEVVRLLEAAPGLKYRAALSVAYGAGLRANEVISLKIGDIDSTRMVIRVEQGKGHKDRYVMLSGHLLELLRAWWKIARPQGWLFPGQNPVNPLTTRQLNRACHAAAQAAGIDKRVSLHTLRHSSPDPICSSRRSTSV